MKESPFAKRSLSQARVGRVRPCRRMLRMSPASCVHQQVGVDQDAHCRWRTNAPPPSRCSSSSRADAEETSAMSTVCAPLKRGSGGGGSWVPDRFADRRSSRFNASRNDSPVRARSDSIRAATSSSSTTCGVWRSRGQQRRKDGLNAGERSVMRVRRPVRGHRNIPTSVPAVVVGTVAVVSPAVAVTAVTVA